MENKKELSYGGVKYMISKASINMFVPNTITALELYEKIFEAKIIDVFSDELSGQKNGARFTIGESLFALADESPEGGKSPFTLGGTPICIQLITDDVEYVLQKSLDAGCKLQMPITVVPGRFKVANITDPFGYIWSLSQVFGE